MINKAERISRWMCFILKARRQNSNNVFDAFVCGEKLQSHNVENTHILVILQMMYFTLGRNLNRVTGADTISFCHMHNGTKFMLKEKKNDKIFVI